MQHYKLLNIDITDKDTLIEFLENQLWKFPSHDIYETDEDIELTEHHHVGLESRLIIEGSPTFFIYGEEVVATPGTYIEIMPHVVHSFKSFFTNKSVWSPIGNKYQVPYS